jgi:hypothetical protein
VALEQHRQDLKGLFLKPDSEAMLPQLASLKIQFEDSKPEGPPKLIVVSHAKRISAESECITG